MKTTILLLLTSVLIHANVTFAQNLSDSKVLDPNFFGTKEGTLHYTIYRYQSNGIITPEQCYTNVIYWTFLTLGLKREDVDLVSASPIDHSDPFNFMIGVVVKSNGAFTPYSIEASVNIDEYDGCIIKPRCYEFTGEYIPKLGYTNYVVLETPFRVRNLNDWKVSKNSIFYYKTISGSRQKPLYR